MTTYPHLMHVEVTTTDERITVHPIWADVDRPDVGGWGLRLTDTKLAGRLVEAILSGAALRHAEFAVDVNGNTYVNANWRVMGRHLNADLRKIGF